jgi:hypothetical protein
MDKPQRKEIVEAMAKAAWQQSGEPEPWDKLPASARREWMKYHDAALRELERLLPDIGRILSP